MVIPMRLKQNYNLWEINNLKSYNMKKSELKKAFKTLKFWKKVLLSTELLNDHNDRIELIEAIRTIKKHTK